jgi:bacterioferritin-associated ferredoxin
MEYNSQDAFPKSRQAASPPASKKLPSLSGLDPAALGLDMPDWLTPSAPSPQAPGDPLPPLPHETLPPQPLRELGQESPASPQVEPRTLLEGMKVVCICKGIKKRIFWKALDDGAQTKDDINRMTGSGSGGCQGRRCGPRILDMLRHHCR